MSDNEDCGATINESHDIAEQDDTTANEAEIVAESVTKPKKKKPWVLTEARKASLEKAHAAKRKKAAEKRELKAETEKKALEIIEDRRLQTSAEDDKLDHVLYELEKIKKHIKPVVSKDIPKNLKPPAPLHRSRKKQPEPDSDSEITMDEPHNEPETTDAESLPPPRRIKSQPKKRSEDNTTRKLNVVFG